MNALLRSGNTVHANITKLQLALVHYDIRDQINTNKSQEESKAVEKIKSSSKYFYSYAKRMSKIKSSINMLYNTSGVFTDPQNMANILQGQFSSVLSDPNNPDIKEPDFQPPEISTPMIDTISS